MRIQHRPAVAKILVYRGRRSCPKRDDPVAPAFALAHEHTPAQKVDVAAPEPGCL